VRRDHLGHNLREPCRVGGAAADVRDDLGADVGDAAQPRAVEVPAEFRVAQAVELLDPRQLLVAFLRVLREVASGLRQVGA